MKSACRDDVLDSARKRLKEKPCGGDTAFWIAVRTAGQLVGGDSMGSRVLPILELLKDELSGTFLDVGCYGGWVYPLVRDRVQYKGIDNWPEAIEAATKLFGDHFELSDLTDYREQHDIVWAMQLHPEMDPGTLFKQLRKLSRRMLILTFTRREDAPPGAEIIPCDVGFAAVYRW